MVGWPGPLYFVERRGHRLRVGVPPRQRSSRVKSVSMLFAGELIVKHKSASRSLLALVNTIAVAVAFGAAPTSATGQELARRLTVRVPATLALGARSLVEGRSALIVRRSADHGGDLILLAQDSVTPDRMESAIYALLTLRALHGDSVESTTKMTPDALIAPATWRRLERHRTRMALAKLREATPLLVPGVGIVRTLAIFLPSRATARASKKLRLTGPQADISASTLHVR